MDWKQALVTTDGDWAYGEDGGMIQRMENDMYSVRSGNIDAACRGDWAKVELVVTTDDIPNALVELNMSPDGWTFE